MVNREPARRTEAVSAAGGSGQPRSAHQAATGAGPLGKWDRAGELLWMVERGKRGRVTPEPEAGNACRNILQICF